MTAPTNTVTSVNNIGIREDLENKIYRVVPEETPFTSNIGKGVKATNATHEWQTETLAAADETNAHLEGDDVGTLDAANLPARVSNKCQIFWKTGGVARTQEIVDKAGRKSEMNRQKVLKGIEIRRDFEKRALGNYASVAESGATARKCGGMVAWLTTNVSAVGANGGFSGGVVAAATNSTQRTLTESLVKAVQLLAFNNGGKPSQAYMAGTHKQQFSAFTGIASIRVDAGKSGQATIIGAADVYQGDFGKLTLIPHPYALTRDVVLVDPNMVAVATLDGIKTRALGVTGDSDRFLMTMEKTLVVRNEKAHAAIRDLT
jgi:hypothetical protein